MASFVGQSELLPGYYLCSESAAWLTLPWPDDLNDLPPSIGDEVIDWCESWLTHHLYGGAWEFTPSQRRFIYMWYAVKWDSREKRWRWLHRSGVRRGSKGSGKDPLLAALALAELCGPVIPSGTKDNLRADSYRLSLVQIAANSEDQASDVLRVANAMVGPEMADAFGFDKGITRTQLASGSKLELLTNSEASSEGDPATFIFLNETHHMKQSNGGQKFARTCRRNVAKSPGGMARALEATNAHMPGERSVAEGSYQEWQHQVSSNRPLSILYDSREAAPRLRLHVPSELDLGIAQAYHDSPWTDRERIKEEALDTRTPAADSVRYFFNALPVHSRGWVDPRNVDACAMPGEVVADGEPIAMFLDCSKSEDATTLVGCRVSDGFVMALGCWERPHGDRGVGWLAPREAIDAVVRMMFDRFAVKWFGVDPSPAKDDTTAALYWGDVIDRWHKDFANQIDSKLWATPGRTYGHSVMFDMRLSTKGANDRMRDFTAMAETVRYEIDGEEGDGGQGFTWDGDPKMRVHLHHAKRRPNQWGMGLGKETRDSSDKVDYAVSTVGARLGRRLVMLQGTSAPETYRVY